MKEFDLNSLKSEATDSGFENKKTWKNNVQGLLFIIFHPFTFCFITFLFKK